MNYRSAIRGSRSYFKLATMVSGLSLTIVFPLWAETSGQRFLTNQATITYTKSDKEIVTSSNESTVPISSHAEIVLKSLMLNGLSPKIVSLLLLESRKQRFLASQAIVTHTQFGKQIVTRSNVSVAPIALGAEIKLKVSNPPKSDLLSKGVSSSL